MALNIHLHGFERLNAGITGPGKAFFNSLLGSAAGQAAFKADNKIADCQAFVATACRILEAVLAEG